MQHTCDSQHGCKADRDPPHGAIAGLCGLTPAQASAMSSSALSAGSFSVSNDSVRRRIEASECGKWPFEISVLVSGLANVETAPRGRVAGGKLRRSDPVGHDSAEHTHRARAYCLKFFYRQPNASLLLRLEVERSPLRASCQPSCVA